MNLMYMKRVDCFTIVSLNIHDLFRRKFVVMETRLQSRKNQNITIKHILLMRKWFQDWQELQSHPLDNTWMHVLQKVKPCLVSFCLYHQLSINCDLINPKVILWFISWSNWVTESFHLKIVVKCFAHKLCDYILFYFF